MVLHEIFFGIDAEILQLQGIQGYSTQEDLKNKVNNIFSVALSILREPYNVNLFINSDVCNFFKTDYLECLKILENISPNLNPSRTLKRRHSKSATNVPLNKKCIVLQSEVNLANSTDMEHDNARPKPSNSESTISAEKGEKYIPFL